MECQIQHTAEEIAEVERITRDSIRFNIACCADMGICEHDLEHVERMKKTLLTK